MSTSIPTTPSPPDRAAEFIRFKHFAALTFVIASPILIALPPRKLDFYTASLSGAFLVSSNHLTRERTGRGFTEHLASLSLPSTPPVMRDLPSERAEEVRAKLKAQKEREAQMMMQAGKEKETEGEQRGVVENIWMGRETEGWKERRLKEEQKALDEGKGYGDLIQEHIWDVWNWGKKDSDGEEKK